ncbi:MAG TPA: DNA mismatch repair endonuclease MutL [Candidatus Kapabacteria bacterium]|jgi:DNA mismatch repair protein MutL|nr:DNA mismatch repair endonuclease MutL [Candidatus Kapabacteria bacterium]
MSRIHKLPDSLANKIAAGEVVQRPESVVKELVENSLDAGATEIAVVVKNAGKSLLYIADNGSGMAEEDARIAFERHATSKITSDEDLDRILTLGFRGEALAAISSVAQVELKTRQEGEELGTLVRVENGVVVEVSKTACDRGTSIAVKNLFFSVPARRKFLKSNATELKHIVETMQRFALAYPEVTFTLSDDDTLLMSVKAGTIEERIRAVYNDEMLNALIALEADGDGVRARGFIGKPNFARKSKTDQYLFLNGRYITSKLLSHAIFTGYEHLLDAQSYPPYIVFLEVDPERVDVNVHPTKSEVKFDDESMIYGLLQAAARRSMSEHNLVPAMRMPQGDTGESVIAALRYALPQYDRAEKFPGPPTRPGPADAPGDGGASAWPPAYGREKPMPTGRAGELMRQLFGEQSAPLPTPSTLPPDAPHPASQLDLATSTPATFRQETRSLDGDVDPVRAGLWQIHNKYILSQLRSGLMIVDQHVAHERILYEQAVRSMQAAMPMSQQLLFPLEMKVTPAEYALMRELRNDITALGFELSIERGDTVFVHGVPHDVGAGQEGAILRELLDQYLEYQQMGMTDQRHMIAASFACRASIKAGDPLSQEEMLNLIENLFATSMPYVCPHGRPIVIRIELSELDRRFGRTS